MWEKERKKKEDKIVLIVVLVLQFDPFRPHTGGGTRFHPVGPSKVFLLPLFFSNILMSRKYHNIKNKCNPFTKQCAINNNQVVFLYCICTVYTQRVTFVVYMYTKTTGSLVFRLFFFFFSVSLLLENSPRFLEISRNKRQT